MDAKVNPEQTSEGQRLFDGWRPEGCDRIALIFQGGGALGAYQAGVYQALHEADASPNWVSGVSIGAINASIIAGNPRESGSTRCGTSGNRSPSRKIWAFTPDGDFFRDAAQSRPAR